MADYLTFLPEKSAKRNIFLQIVFEIWYIILYTLLYIPGLLIRPGDAKEGDKRPVVLISGFFGSPLTWLKCRKALIEQGHPVYVVRLGFQCGNLNRYSEMLQHFLEDSGINDGYLVCHSMGGLVAANMGYKGRDRTRKIFTLGTPFKGHPLAPLVFFSIAGWQMFPLTKFMRQTKQKYRTLSSIQAIFARFDEINFTPSLNIPGRFDDVKLTQVGHCNLFMGPAGIECITELIQSEESKDPKPVPLDKTATKEKTNTEIVFPKKSTVSSKGKKSSKGPVVKKAKKRRTPKKKVSTRKTKTAVRRK